MIYRAKKRFLFCFVDFASTIFVTLYFKVLVFFIWILQIIFVIKIILYWTFIFVPLLQMLLVIVQRTFLERFSKLYAKSDIGQSRTIFNSLIQQNIWINLWINHLFKSVFSIGSFVQFFNVLNRNIFMSFLFIIFIELINLLSFYFIKDFFFSFYLKILIVLNSESSIIAENFKLSLVYFIYKILFLFLLTVSKLQTGSFWSFNWRNSRIQRTGRCYTLHHRFSTSNFYASYFIFLASSDLLI